MTIVTNHCKIPLNHYKSHWITINHYVNYHDTMVIHAFFTNWMETLLTSGWWSDTPIAIFRRGRIQIYPISKHPPKKTNKQPSFLLVISRYISFWWENQWFFMVLLNLHEISRKDLVKFYLICLPSDKLT